MNDQTKDTVNVRDEFIPTRQSLLSRLKDWNDHDSWKVFFDTYWKLIYNTAIRAGLTETEAQDVVQETVICVCKSMPTFEYNVTGSFKQWLLRLTGWRIVDQMRKRDGVGHSKKRIETLTGTEVMEEIADAGSLNLERNWDADWEQNLLDAAIERVKAQVDPKQYQVFDLCIFKGWPASRVAQTLGINVGRVYIAKHRINKLIKREVERLRTKPI